MLPIVAQLELDGRKAIVRAPSFRLGREIEQISKRYRDGDESAAWDMIEAVIPACVRWEDGSEVDLGEISAEAAANAAKAAISGGGSDPTEPQTKSVCGVSVSTPPQSR